MISIICAVARNGAIGYQNRLLYHLGADLRRFKALTMGHTIVMGRRTFESLPKGALPGRRNVVLTRNTVYQATGADVYSSLTAALASEAPEADVFIIGGASVYAEALPLAGRLCLTEVLATPPQADVFFPQFDRDAWREVAREHHEADERNAVPFDFADYVRR